MISFEALESLPPATLYWIQLTGWLICACALIGGFACSVRSLHYWSLCEWGPYFRCLLAMAAFMALMLVGIWLTLIGPQQI